eukprot:TRINITY_DN29111_c0_g1_i1.p1 TRINITY_DN29111_c0_g1~~TRINITY_DN29111_c0_g1_i1.p1  ORF type:complete len:470 (-),score=75.06 TRINITY_DN29111_c0_g1_i1:302-1711(-)
MPPFSMAALGSRMRSACGTSVSRIAASGSLEESRPFLRFASSASASGSGSSSSSRRTRPEPASADSARPLSSTASVSVHQQAPFEHAPYGYSSVTQNEASAGQPEVRTAVEKAPTPVHSALRDTFGRRHSYLRVSLTDRCNLRCQYCMPEEGDEERMPSSNSDILSAEELRRLVDMFVDLGVRKVRLTGGEPTIRRDFGRIVEDLGAINAKVDNSLSLGITTNGVRLHKFLPVLQQAGLRNINLSLDTLVSKKFPLIGRKPAAWHDRIMETMRAVAERPEDFTLKVNCCVLRGVNEDELGAFLDLTEHLPIEVRFLEFMPFVGNSWSEGRFVSQEQILAALRSHLAARHPLGAAALEKLPPDSLNDVARLWKVTGWKGRIGVIASMTDAFCGGCNRIRLTADGEIRNCLFGEEGWSLRDDLRAGASDGDLVETVARCVSAKYRKLGGKQDMQELQERSAQALPMVALGG